MIVAWLVVQKGKTKAKTYMLWIFHIIGVLNVAIHFIHGVKVLGLVSIIYISIS
jgi:hypothetical protein